MFGSIFVNTDEADKSMAKTEKNAESIATKFGNGIKTAAKWGSAIVGGATAAASAVVGLATNAADTADEIDKMSQKIGISTESYQEWSYVMGQNGMDVEKLSVGMKTLVSQMDSAASGTASAQENFDKLGVSIYDASGKLKDQETMLNEAMHALADMENGTEKARLATELFGKAGIEMMPMLNQGSGAMDELTQRAHDLGLVMSEEAVGAGVTLGDTIDDIKQSFSAVGRNLGTAVIPVVQQFAEVILQSMPMIQEAIGALAPILADVVASFLPALIEVAQMLLPMLVELINQLLPVITEIAAAILPMITGLIQQVMPFLMQIVEAVLPLVTTMLNAIMPILTALFDILSPIFEVVTALIAPLVEIMSTILQPIITLVSTLIEVALKPLIPVVEAVAEVITTILGAAFEALAPIIESITDVFGGLIDFITGVFSGNWEKAWDGIVNIFKGIFNLIPSAIEGIINGAIGLINGIINGINGITGVIGIPAIPNIPTVTLPKLEEGGILEKGQVGILEGNGAEAVVPLENNKKWIASIANEMQAQGIGGDAELMTVLLDIMRKILAEMQELNRKEMVQIVPDENGIFKIVRKKAREFNDTTGDYALI